MLPERAARIQERPRYPTRRLKRGPGLATGPYYSASSSERVLQSFIGVSDNEIALSSIEDAVRAVGLALQGSHNIASRDNAGQVPFLVHKNSVPCRRETVHHPGRSNPRTGRW